MKMPSRQTLAKLIFFTFVVFFAAIIALYLFNPFSSNDSENGDFLENEKRGSVFAPFGNFFSGDDSEDEITRPVIDEEQGGGEDETDDSPIPKLRQISTSPTVAAIFYLDEKEIEQTDRDLAENNENFSAFKKNTIRYILKENGHVFETHSDTFKESRISNTTIPKIGEAMFTGPLTMVFRYAGDDDEIKTFSAEMIDNPNGTEGMKLQGIFLPDNIIDMDVSVAGKFLYSEKTSGGSDFITTNYLGEEKTRVSSSPLSEFNIDFTGKTKTALLSVRPSANIFGQIFSLDTETGSLTTILSGQKGLSGLANSNMSKVAISSKVGDQNLLRVRDNSTGEIFNTGLETFVDKCVWSLDNVNLYCGVPENSISDSAPDTWYQGIDSYSDKLWSINTETRSFELVMNPSELENVSIDMTEVKLSADEQFIHFINKKDLTLWSYKLN